MNHDGPDRRKEPRFLIGAAAQLRREGLHEVFHATTVNVSTSGVMLRMALPCDFKVGEKLTCEIALPGYLESVFASWGFGRVVRVDDAGTAVELMAAMFYHSDGETIDTSTLPCAP